MKLTHVLNFFFMTLLVGCDNTIDFDNGPCKFAPPESKFPELQFAYCDECYFKIQLMGKEYSFTGKQIETIPSAAGWDPPEKINLIRLTRNTFFKFCFISPDTNELLRNSIGLKTRLLKMDTLPKLNDFAPPPVSVSFGIYNYCNVFFEPTNNAINESNHQLTKVELIESYPAEIDLDPYQISFFYCSGELSTIIFINGETEAVTAQYKVKTEIWEKL